MAQLSLSDIDEHALPVARDRGISPTLYVVSEDGVAYPPAADAGGAETPRALGRIDRLLGAHNTAARQRLGEQIRDATRAERSGVMLLRDGNGAAQLVSVRPAREPGEAVVQVDALESAITRLSPALLIELFGLAPAEAEISLALANDRSIFDIAAARHVQPETVRGQVKSLMRKMNLCSQKQLVRLLTRLDMALDR